MTITDKTAHGSSVILPLVHTSLTFRLILQAYLSPMLLRTHFAQLAYLQKVACTHHSPAITTTLPTALLLHTHILGASNNTTVHHTTPHNSLAWPDRSCTLRKINHTTEYSAHSVCTVNDYTPQCIGVTHINRNTQNDKLTQLEYATHAPNFATLYASPHVCPNPQAPGKAGGQVTTIPSPLPQTPPCSLPPCHKP